MGRSPLARILRRRRTAALVAEHIVAIDVARVHMCGPLRNERLPHSMCPATTPHRNDFRWPHEFAAGVCPKLSYGSTAPEKLPGNAWRFQAERSGLQTQDAHLQVVLGCGALPGGLRVGRAESRSRTGAARTRTPVAQSDSCGVRTHALADWRLEPALRPLGQTVLGVGLAKSSSLTVARPRSAQVTRVTLRAKQPRRGRVARSRGLVVDVFGGLRKAWSGSKI